LAEIAPHLPEPLLAEALAAARTISDEEARSRSLTALAPHLPATEREAALREALAAARAISNDDDRARSLTALAPHLPDGEREAALREALAAARAISNDGARARSLAEIAPHLPETLKFAQTFATRILPKNPQLPELLFISMSRGADINLFEAVAELEAELATSEDDSDSPGLEARGFTTGGKELLETALTWHLRSGTVGRLSMFDLSNYRNVALDIIETAEIPVTASPLKGATLAALAGGGGASILDLFHSGVGMEEAGISILFLAGTVVIFGAAKGVARALEKGLEQKVLQMFGVTQQRTVSARRVAGAITPRVSRRRAKTASTVEETQAQVDETSTKREAHAPSAVVSQQRAAYA
jgi:hypothetical protein